MSKQEETSKVQDQFTGIATILANKGFSCYPYENGLPRDSQAAFRIHESKIMVKGKARDEENVDVEMIRTLHVYKEGDGSLNLTRGRDFPFYGSGLRRLTGKGVARKDIEIQEGSALDKMRANFNAIANVDQVISICEALHKLSPEVSPQTKLQGIRSKDASECVWGEDSSQ